MVAAATAAGMECGWRNPQLFQSSSISVVRDCDSQTWNKMMRLAVFVTPHGFGHAARACALIQAIADQRAGVGFEIFTTVPDWFFRQSLSVAFGYHLVATDLGLVQKGPLQADLPATVARLDRFLPFDPGLVDALAIRLAHLNCRAVICDIAPLGIAVARHAGIPSILVENFTWDWIYRAYAGNHPGFCPHIDYLERLFAGADCHIQTDPVCRVAKPALRVGPISRKPRQNRAAVRAALGIADGVKLVSVSMGGVPGPDLVPAGARLPDGIVVVLATQNPADAQVAGVVRLGADSAFYHPDLVEAADAVVGKIGYSTLAEVCLAGIAYGFVARADCPEAPVLAAYARRHMACLPIDPCALANGRWLDHLAPLLALPRQADPPANAADQAATAILDDLAAWLKRAPLRPSNP